MLIVPLSDPQICFGAMWLKGLGPTMWDFNKHTLKFWREDRVVTFQRIQATAVDVVSRELFDKIL